MSALQRTTDSRRTSRHVRKVPGRDIPSGVALGYSITSSARSRRNRLPYEAFGRTASATAVRSTAEETDYLSGITISRSLVSTTNIASSFAGAVVLAFWLIW
jgi:hypothetical protein